MAALAGDLGFQVPSTLADPSVARSSHAAGDIRGCRDARASSRNNGLVQLSFGWRGAGHLCPTPPKHVIHGRVDLGCISLGFSLATTSNRGNTPLGALRHT